MFRKSNFVVASLLVFVFGFQSMADGPNGQPYTGTQRQQLVQVYKTLMPHPGAAAAIGFADWPAAEQKKIQKEADLEVTSLPPLEFEGNKIKIVVQGHTHMIEVVDRASRMFLVDGKLFKLDPTKTIAELKKELREGNSGKTALSRLFFDSAEAQGWEEVVAVLLVLAAIGSVLKYFLWGPLMNKLEPYLICESLDVPSSQVETMKPKDLKKLTTSLEESKDVLAKLVEAYRKQCSDSPEKSGCGSMKTYIDCLAQRSSALFTNMDNLHTLDQTEFTDAQRNRFNDARGAFEKVLDTAPMDFSQPLPAIIVPSTQGTN